MTMNPCRRTRELIVDALYGELEASDRQALLAHLDQCAACRAEYGDMKRIAAARTPHPAPELPESYWQGYQERLELKLAAQRRPAAWSWRDWLASAWLKPAMLTASVLLLIGLGILIDRQLVRREPVAASAALPAPTPPLRAAYARNQEPLANYLQELKPLLIDWAQAAPAGNETATAITVDAAELKRLLMQNYLLKQLLARAHRDSQKQVLDELELILLEMSAASHGDPERTEAVRQLIRRDDVLFKINIISQGQRAL